MGEVITLDCMTTLPIPVDRVLDAAKTCDYVLVLGWKDGDMWTAASDSDLEKALWLASKFIHRLHSGDFL